MRWFAGARRGARVESSPAIDSRPDDEGRVDVDACAGRAPGAPVRAPQPRRRSSGSRRCGGAHGAARPPERRPGRWCTWLGTNGKGSTAAMLAATRRPRRPRRAAGRPVHLARTCTASASGSRSTAWPSPTGDCRAWRPRARGGRGPRRADLLRAADRWRRCCTSPDAAARRTWCSRPASAVGSTRPPRCQRRWRSSPGWRYDHQDLLGAELRAIAGEKAGILRPGSGW
jgi:hypothetical protein